ncbi:PD40 domain-containing protein [Paractinoplanes rishiriensis]|uniref:Uncharacterized protein n=1 Tax=Paractinoplanes rishiriensis TaxID=1050105 RepID=A0A919KCR1_9ACTN|nr:PD40 domain-containing protein [Actinoplanes rishiriensis]GIF01307.1 hypothetical protein Ari01nite_87710 [Actinoplanes rishiriensis]
MGTRQRTITLAALGGLLAMTVLSSPAAAAPRPAPGGRILYLDFDGSTAGSGTLKSVRPTGWGRQDFGLQLFWASSPDYSPTGFRIAYLRDINVHHMAADGSDDRNLGAPNLGIGFPRWSPDGRWITVESWGDIVAVHRDGSSVPPVNLTSAHDSNDLVAAWAPGGRRFATANYAAVRVYSADGVSGRDLAALPGAYRLDWNPDGRSLAVEALGDLWVVTVPSGAVRRLTDTPEVQETSPVWSPDGRWLAYGRGPGAHDPDFPGVTTDPVIWLMRRDGRGAYSTAVPGVPSSWRAAG